MFDVFYIGKKPNLFPHERPATDIEDARQQSRTRYFWITSYLADYTDWDWLWEPPPWQAYQCHAWPSQWQRNSGTMLVPRLGYNDTNYHSDRSIMMRACQYRWTVPDHIDADSVDQSWHPDADESPWIYHFASQHQHSSGVTYTCDGAKDIKFDTTMQVQSRADRSQWHIPDWIDPDSVDYSWHPDSLQPAYIYHFASQHQAASGVTYTVPGATHIKLCRDIAVRSVPVRDHWHIPDWIDPDSVDYSWHPDSLQPAYIYHFASQHQAASGVTYTVPGATSIKLCRDIAVRSVPVRDHWHIPDWIDPDSVDYSWHADALVPPYIYHFASQHQSASGVTYTVPGATHIKLCRDIAVRSVPVRDHWHIPDWIDPDSVDYSWHPDSLQPAYIYHFASQHQAASGVTYTVPGATHIKLVDTVKVKSIPQTHYWHVPDWIDPDSVDYSWHADALVPPYIYHFASQHQSASGVTYTVPGATDIRIDPGVKVKSIPQTHYWHVPGWIDADSIDYSWHADALAPPYIYHFATSQGWDRVGGPEYRVPGAVECKHIDDIVARTQGNPDCWVIPEWIDPDSIDQTWCPHPDDPAMIYEFPVEWGWNRVGGPQYCVPGAEQIKYVADFVARTRPGSDLWVQDRIADDDAVRRWRPNPADPPYIYVFGNQWWPAEKRASVEYRVPGAHERKFMPTPRARRIPTTDNYSVLIDCDFDFSWEPDPGDPAYIYVFGNQWWPAEKMPTVEYHVPGAQERKFMSQPRAALGTNPDEYWYPLETCTWDSTWRPDPGDIPYIYVFGNQWWPAETWPTLEYRVPGAIEHKYIDYPRAQLPGRDSGWWIPDGIDPDSINYSWQPDPGSPPYVYEFGTQWQKTGGARYTVPGATEIKYASAFRCRKTSRDSHWHMPQDLATIIEDFDWTWHPDSTEEAYIYEFGSQHQKTGGPEYHVPGAVQRKYVDQVRVTVRESRARAVIIDHMDNNARAVHEQIVTSVGVTKTVRYVTSYLDTLKRIAAQVDEEWIWIVSSVCDYHGFDFTWYPEQWQATMLHVFASDDLKFGDTFFMHVPTFRERAGRAKLLEWYDVNFVEQSVPRRAVPVIQHADDTHVDAIRSYITRVPVTLFATDTVPTSVPAVNLWRPEVKTVIPLDAGASRVLVPREAISAITTQVYDYAYIDKTHRGDLGCAPLDIVFISNGEANADQNWGALLLSKQGAPNRCVRVDGVNGRAAAYHAAAEASETAWFFAVFAKLQVLDNFDWSWQPDRLQRPKHYIFHALNPVNQLEYGHQAMIAYNRALTLANPGRGLDFTLDDAHEVVPVLSGVARYNVDAWTAWRTAFREVIKLQASLPDVESEYRIRQWLSNGSGPYGDFSRYGAQDALDYFEEVNGDFAELRKSYEWSWLASYALLKRNVRPGQ